MKLTSSKFTKLTATLRNYLTLAIKRGDDKAASKHLGRLNKVLSIARGRNLANGMPGKPWVNVSLADAKAKISPKSVNV